MAIKVIKRTNWSGGMTSVGEKVGEENSARWVKGLNIHESPDYVTLARKTTKVSGDTVTDLIHWIVDGSPWDTNRYFYSSGGKIYRETSADAWSSLRTVSGGGGEGLLVFDNYLYYPLATNIGRYGPLDGTPAFDDDFSSWWISTQIQDSGGGTGAADYVPPTSISEAATALQTFEASYDPIVSITIDVDVVGSGNWTVTLHNANNDTIASKTIANGSMTTGDVTFTFSAVARVVVGEDYHFHVTSTVADGGVDTDVATDLEGAEYTIQYQALIDANFHPMVEMLNGWVVGNEHYLGYFDNATYNPNQIELAPGFEARSITKLDEYVVATCWRGASFDEAEEARNYYWDGIEPTFNFFTDVTVGVPNAIANYKNTLVGIYGNRGSLYQNDAPFEEIIDEVPKLVRGKSIEVYPGALDIFEGKLVIGYGAVTDDGTGLEQGVYMYGSQTDQIASALSYPFIISTDSTQGTTLKIGCVKSFGDDLYISWRDGSSYGVDKIAAGDGTLASGASFEDRILDVGNPQKRKQAIKLECTFEALTTGQSVALKYKVNRATNFTTGTAESTVGATETSLYINSIFYELEWGINIASSSNTFVKVTSISLIYEPLEDEDESA